MKKFVIGFLAFIGLGFSTIFADEILPNDVDIEIKSPLIQGEATNLKITMLRDGQPLSSYTGTIWIDIVDENGSPLRESEYTLPGIGGYEFLPTDQGSKEFQRGLEIKKEGRFYIKVSDLLEDIEYGETLVDVIKNSGNNHRLEFNVYTPTQRQIIVTNYIDIFANISDRFNSPVTIYLDNASIATIPSDSDGSVSYTISNIETGPHSIKLIASDYEGNIIGESEEIYFSYSPQKTDRYKGIDINPDFGLMVGDIVDFVVHTDEMAESVKMNLSDRSENDSIVLLKDENGQFSTHTFLIGSGDVNISLEIFTPNSSDPEIYENIKTMQVSDIPEISNVKVDADEVKQEAVISRNTSNDLPTSFLLNYWVGNGDNIKQFDPERTDEKSYKFTEVPYDIDVYLTITPYRDESQKHGSASQTITFKIKRPEEKCGNKVVDEGEDCNTCPEDLGDICIEPEIKPSTPKCTIQNISTRTERIGNNYYLIWDKVENISKYVVYSSSNADGSDKVKVFETKDTSYEYPFDYSSEEDKFMYFWIVGICDDGEELQLTGATKVQVGPTENFFLLLCITFIIYFGIKLFRQTEE